MHVDGSAVMGPNKANRAFVLGFAVVANLNGTEIEHTGAYQVPFGIKGDHETVAVVEGVLLAAANGVLPEHTVIHTDDEGLGNAQLYLHPGNFSGRADGLRERIRRVCTTLYPEGTDMLVLEYLLGARLHKLKGHTQQVYQERADYLAKQHAWNLLKSKHEPVLSYDIWLSKGMLVYESPEEASRWYAPFVKPLTEDAVC